MSITEQQILSAEGEELEQILGEVLNLKRQTSGFLYGEPVALNWDNAMKHFREAKPDSESLLSVFMWHIENEHEHPDIELMAIEGATKEKLVGIALHWLSFEATEAHYLKITAIFKIGAKT